MKLPIIGACAALLCLVLASCVPSGTGTGGSASAAPVMKIDGRPISAEDLVSSPFMRQSVRELIVYETMMSIAKQENVTVEQKDIDKNFQDRKQQVSMGDEKSWQDYLAQNLVTEEEFKQQVSGYLYFQALVKNRVKVSDEEIKKSWETERDTNINVYAQKNKIPDAEKAKLTFDQVKASIKERLESMKGMSAQGDLLNELVAKATLELPAISDAAKRKIIEDLVLNKEKDRVKKEMEAKAEGAKAGAGGMPPSGGAPPAGSTPPEGGTPPAGSTPPPAGSTPPPAGTAQPPAGGGK